MGTDSKSGTIFGIWCVDLLVAIISFPAPAIPPLRAKEATRLQSPTMQLKKVDNINHLVGHRYYFVFLKETTVLLIVVTLLMMHCTS